MNSQLQQNTFRLKHISVLGLLLYSSYIVYSALQWEIYSPMGPGPGLFPLILGVILFLLSLLWLFTLCVGDADADQKLSRAAYVRIGSVILIYIFSIFFMETLGFAVTAFIMMAISLRVLGRHNFWVVCGISFATSFFCFFVFQKILGVSLPLMDLAALA